MGKSNAASMAGDLISATEALARKQAALAAQTDEKRVEQQVKNKQIMNKETGSAEMSGRQGTVAASATDKDIIEKDKKRITLLGSAPKETGVKTLLGE